MNLSIEQQSGHIEPSTVTISNMDASYSDFEQELKLLKDRIESVESIAPNERGRFGYKCVNNLDRWRSERENMYKIITNPTATVIFYTRTIIEALTTGALTEKEIRTSTLDICKDLGIKSTCRGTIAGLNLDVPAICNILASYGVLELDTSSISTINVRNSLSTYRKQLIDQGKEQANQVQSDTTIANHSSGSTNDIDVIDGELNTLALADVTGKSFLGDEIFRSISLRWKEKLTKYLLDSQSTHIQGLQIAALAATAAAAKSASDSLINTDFDGTSSANVQFSTSNEFYFDTTDHQIYEENGEDIYTDMRTMVAPNSNTNSVPSPKANTSFWSTEAVDSLPISSSNDISNGYFYDNFNNSSNSNNYNNNNNSSSTNVNNSDPIADLVETTGNEATSKVLKRASNQRAWRLAVDVSHLRNPEKLLNEWSDACYAESAALETEEAVLRRLVGQCKLGIDNKPRRLGTAYLTQTLVENSAYGQSDLDLPGPRTLRQGAELTGDQLWEKARAAFVRKKLQSKGIPRASLGSSDTMNAYGVSFSMPHPSTIGEDGSGYLTHTGANKYVKKITNAAGTGETRAQHGVATFRAARLRSYVPPVVLQHDGVYRESVTQKGSIFASQFPAPPSSFPATVIRPDLMLFTTAIPWSALAREFVTMDYEDLHHESAISSANPSQPNSARGTSFTPKYENSSSHIYDKKSDRISLTNSPHKLQSGDKGARRPLSISVSMPTLGTFPVSAPASNSKPSEVLAPTFTEIEPISEENYRTWRLMPTASTTLSSKDDLNCSREIFHDNSSTDDAEDVEDISDEAIDMRHNETLRKMRDRWMQLQQLRKEQKLQSGGPNALKSASGSANKHSHSYGHKKKYKSSTPRSEFGVSKGSIPKSTYSSRKRGRGRPPKSNHSQYVHAVEKSEGIQSGNGSAKEDDDSSHGIDNDNENENENEHFGHEEETDSAIDKEDEEEETEELPDLKRLHTRSSNINSPTHSVNSRRVIH